MSGIKEYRNGSIERHRGELELHIREILRLVGEDPEREGLRDTPSRVVNWYAEMLSGYGVDPRDVLGDTFDERHEELVIVKDIMYYSLCEHHLVPFFGKAHIGYIPSGKIAGLSKLARLVDAVTKRLQVQERLTSQIADTLEEVLKPHGVMVVVEGEHLCMCARGVKKYGSKTVTSAVRGQFLRSAAARSEFLSLIRE
ncbi:MAG: GTP cyclohydrolase I FolE [Paenibacillaceae bacterium ZCTH02-B3]|nr:MAG: GTP cyclohydrolase I FolE [Paenibacillaceae bacterium ZCTH02-B3]